MSNPNQKERHVEILAEVMLLDDEDTYLFKKDNNNYSIEPCEALTAMQRVEEEKDAEISNLQKDYVFLKLEFDALRSENERLKGYVRHDEGCHIDFNLIEPFYTCTCGLEKKDEPQGGVVKAVCTCTAFHKSDECYELGCKVHRNDDKQKGGEDE